MCRKKEKTPQFSGAELLPQRELLEPENFARFNHSLQLFLRTGLNTRVFPGIEHQIISTIKTIRKKN
jgi:hypothetical protein